MIRISNGLIYNMIEDVPFIGTILIDNGKIIQVVKQGVPTLPKITNELEIDATGLFVMPGLIESHCHVGISGDKKTKSSDDGNEITDPVTPYLRGMDAINPLDPAFHSAIEAGITTLMSGPGSSNIVAGQFVCMKTHSATRNIENMLVLAPSAMKVSFGENPKNAYTQINKAPMTRMGIVALLREELSKAQTYLLNTPSSNEVQKDMQEQKEVKVQQQDFRLECWRDVFEKKIPLKAHVHRADDILTAIRIANEFNLNITLDHCSEGHLIVDEIKKSGFPAIVGPSMVNRNKEEVVNIDFKTAGILNKKGIPIAITTDHPVIQVQYLAICAGLAVKKGLPMMEGLRAITRYPAQICGVSERLGTIEAMKDADIAIFDGNPMNTFTNTIYTIINGVVVYDKNKENIDL